MNLNEKLEQVIEKEIKQDDMMSSYISFILYDQDIGEVEPRTILVQSDEVESSMFLSN